MPGQPNREGNIWNPPPPQDGYIIQPGQAPDANYPVQNPYNPFTNPEGFHHYPHANPAQLGVGLPEQGPPPSLLPAFEANPNRLTYGGAIAAPIPGGQLYDISMQNTDDELFLPQGPTAMPNTIPMQRPNPRITVRRPQAPSLSMRLRFENTAGGEYYRRLLEEEQVWEDTEVQSLFDPALYDYRGNPRINGEWTQVEQLGRGAYGSVSLWERRYPVRGVSFFSSISSATSLKHPSRLYVH